MQKNLNFVQKTKESVVDVHTAAVSEIIPTGGGLSQLKEIAAILYIPSISNYK